MEIGDIEKSKDFIRVYRLLINAAEYRGTVTYGEVAKIMGLPQSGNLMSMRTGQMLGTIVERERNAVDQCYLQWPCRKQIVCLAPDSSELRSSWVSSRPLPQMRRSARFGMQS